MTAFEVAVKVAASIMMIVFLVFALVAASHQGWDKAAYYMALAVMMRLSSNLEDCKRDEP